MSVENGRSYLRHPHVHGDTVVFVAEDDVWAAPVAGGRAYRLTADGVPAARPRLSPDGTRVAWTARRDGAPEVYVGGLDGGPVRRLTHWGDHVARGLGWSGPDEVVAVTAAGRPSAARRWAHAVPVDGRAPRPLPYGPLADLARGAAGEVLLLSVPGSEPAWWKRYRGGTTGKLWWDPDGTGGFARIGADLDGNVEAPMLVGGRIAFVGDHEGWGNLYSLDRAGGDLRRHTDHGGPDAPPFYVRHASTDGERVVYESAGRLWLLESLDAAPRPLAVHLGGPRTAREPHRVCAAQWLSSARPDRTGRTSVVVVRGTVHRLTHRDGPARTLLAQPGVRARLAAPLGTDRAVWVDDRDGEEAVCVVPLDPMAEDAPPPRRFGTGELGRVLELAPAPDGNAVALACHDGRLLILDLTRGEGGELREPARGADGEVSDLSWSPDSAWLAYADPVEAALTRIMMLRLADDTLVAGHRAALRRQRARVHRRRALPRVPVQAQLRPDLRRPRLRPDLPHVVAPVPGAAGRAHPLPVRRHRRGPADRGP